MAQTRVKKENERESKREREREREREEREREREREREMRRRSGRGCAKSFCKLESMRYACSVEFHYTKAPSERSGMSIFHTISKHHS